MHVMKLLRKTNILLLFIIIIAVFFRFYNFKELQFWNADDEILTATIRHIIWDKSPTLLIPNLFLEFGLGPIFYYLLTPFYLITNFDLVNLRIIASVIGLATTYFIYLAGKSLKDNNVGLIAAYLYASSFLVAFLERRIWPLTLNGLMAVLALWCLLKIIDKNYKYIPLLALPIGFTFNSDLSLLVVIIAVSVIWVIYKLPLLTKYTFYFLSIILLFIVPFILAEIMYNHAVSGPLLKTISKPFDQQAISPGYFQKFQIRMPRFITRQVSDENNFSGKKMPFLLGAGTFFLPCGFTVTSQGVALLSGSFWQGGLIMLFFALGTAPMLFLIGLSSVKFVSRPHTAAKFLKTAGLLVLFFALFNINAQFNVLGWPSISDWFNSGSPTKARPTTLIEGEQVIKMEASASGYQPDYFKIKVGVPVRWEIKDTGTSGCTNAVIARGLFSGQIDLKPGKTAIKKFTPLRVGRYKFSCWMGMINGIIDVVDS